MTKKRRDFTNVQTIDLNATKGSLTEKIASLSNTSTNNGVRTEHFHLKPTYGKGFITRFRAQEINVIISEYQLFDDLCYRLLPETDVLQISFLLKGEKIISITGEKEIFYENRESYFANIKDFNGYVRILGGKFFKEIKIRLPISFFLDHGFVNDQELKKLGDSKLILPITDELFSILMHLERKDISGTANKIYLKAKVLELMAIQMENYKHIERNPIRTNDEKVLKKLYSVKQTIKSNLHENFSLKQLSNEVGLNSNTLNKEFIRVFGCTVNEFATIEKMNKAKNLLENTQKMVYQVAEEVGYKNATHFTAAFKRKFEMTPNTYRKAL